VCWSSLLYTSILSLMFLRKVGFMRAAILRVHLCLF
jgi:hypothetical protein